MGRKYKNNHPVSDGVKSDNGIAALLRRADELLCWMSLKDYITEELYEKILALAEEKEDAGKPSDFGFSLYMYDIAINSGTTHFSETCVGLKGLCAMISNALRWFNEEFDSQGIESEFDVFDEAIAISSYEELEKGILRELLSRFSEEMESVCELRKGCVNIHFSIHGTSKEIPESIDMNSTVFDNIGSPESILRAVKRLTQYGKRY